MSSSIFEAVLCTTHVGHLTGGARAGSALGSGHHEHVASEEAA